MNFVYATPEGIAYAAGDGTLLGFESSVLITDRTAADVSRWKALHDKGWEAMSPEERTEWTSGMKGAYKHTDMNRVESYVEGLLERFHKSGSKLTLTVKTDWTRTGWPTASDMNRYFGNVEALRVETGVNINAPATPTTNTLFDYKKANALEQILLEITLWLDRREVSQMYSGDLYLGEV